MTAKAIRNVMNCAPTASPSEERLPNADGRSSMSSDVTSSVSARAKVASMKAIARSNSDWSREYRIRPPLVTGTLHPGERYRQAGLHRGRLEPSDAALDDVPAGVDLDGEDRWSATGGASGLTPGDRSLCSGLMKGMPRAR